MIYRSILLTGAIMLGLVVREAQAQERWQGTYGGLSLSRQDITADVEGSLIHRYSKDITTIGFYGGHNFVSRSGFVWGPDVHLTAFSVSEARRSGRLGISKLKGRFLLSPRIRLGFATDQAMFYGVAGIGITDLNVKSVADDGLDILGRLAFGLGVEVATSDTWSLRAEAMTYGLDMDDRPFGIRQRDVDGDIQQISIGFMRRF